MLTLLEVPPEAMTEMPLTPVVADIQSSPRAAHRRAGQFPNGQSENQTFDGLGVADWPACSRVTWRENLCPLCRASMRSWALAWRTIVLPKHETLCVRTAMGFRDECLHTDRKKYDALVAKLKSLPLKTSRLTIALWAEIERIKNCHGGNVPSGRTFNAWRTGTR